MSERGRERKRKWSGARQKPHAFKNAEQGSSTNTYTGETDW